MLGGVAAAVRSGTIEGTSADTTFPQETVVVPLNEMCFNTPTLMSKLVPPKNCAVIWGTCAVWLNKLGRTAIKVRKIAPAKVRRVMV